jgi:hypothetical protein
MARGKDEGQGLTQMGSDLLHHCLFAIRFPHQADATLGQVTDTTVEQARRSAAGPRGEIALFYQRYPQSPQGRVAGDPSPNDTTSDDQ